MHSWGKFWTKDTKASKNPAATSGELRTSARYCGTVCAPCTQYHQRGGQTTQATPLTQPLDTTSPHLNKEQTPLGGSQQQGNLLFVITPPLAVAGTQ